jgi:alpha-beta hydrolase superfamily lysophospholipase
MWDLWRRHLGSHGWEVMVLDLRGHGLSMPTELETVTLEDYVHDLASVAPQIEAARGVAPVIAGWSTGALLSMMYAASEAAPPALLLLSPYLPQEAGGKAPIETVRAFGGELLGPEAFGLFPGNPARSHEVLAGLDDAETAILLERIAPEQESGIAYRQALRGVSVDRADIACPVLSLHSDADRTAGEALKAYLGNEAAYIAADAWGMVRHEAAVIEAAALVDEWLIKSLGMGQEV